MFPRLPNTEQPDNRIRHHGIQFSFESFSVIHLTIFCIYKRLVYCRNAECGIRGLTFRLKITRWRDIFLSFGRGQDPFGIIRTFVMKITFILFIQLANFYKYFVPQFNISLVVFWQQHCQNQQFVPLCHVIKYHYYRVLAKLRTQTHFRPLAIGLLEQLCGVAIKSMHV